MPSARRQTRGAFISVEGVDGAGKTTHIEFIGECLQKHSRKSRAEIVRTREPGGTALGESLRGLLLELRDVEISAESELLLLFAARMQHLQSVILPALARGDWVLCERFTDASYAYQGGGRGVDAQKIAALENWTQGDLRPDLTLLLDLPAAVAAARTQARCVDADRFEREADAFKQSVRRAYLEISAREPERMQTIDAGRELDAVRRDIESEIAAFCKKFHATHAQVA